MITIDSRTFQLFQDIYWGAGALSRLGEAVREKGTGRALLVTDPNVAAAGHLKAALGALKAAEVDVVVFQQVEENPTTDTVLGAADFARTEGPIDLIIGLGGGSSMDCAKGTNFLLTNGGSIEDYWGYEKASKPMLPSIGIPTTAGTGSEAQSYALISQSQSHRKMACGDPKALFGSVILDPALTLTMPSKLTAVTGLDAVAHAVESFVTANRNPVSQLLAREAWRLFDSAFETVLEDPDNLEARAEMLWGAHLAGAGIERSMLGAAHACANPLTASFDLTHGVAVGTMLPHVIEFNAGYQTALYEGLFTTNGRPQRDVSDRVREFLQAAELPLRLRDHGIPSTSLEELAKAASQEWTGQYNPRKLGPSDFLDLYQAAY